MIHFLQMYISIHIWPQFKLWICLGLYQLCTSGHCHFSSILLCRAIQAWSVCMKLWVVSLFESLSINSQLDWDLDSLSGLSGLATPSHQHCCSKPLLPSFGFKSEVIVLLDNKCSHSSWCLTDSICFFYTYTFQGVLQRSIPTAWYCHCHASW